MNALIRHLPFHLQSLFLLQGAPNQEIPLQEHSNQIVPTEFEKEALPLIAKAFNRANPPTPQLFSRLILTLWLRGELQLHSFAGISPTLASCVLEEPRGGLSKLLWQKEAIADWKKEVVFSTDLAKKDVDSALKFMGSHEIRTLYALRNGIELPWPTTPPQMLFFESDEFMIEQHGRLLEYKKAESYNPDTFFKSLTPGDKIKLWEKVSKSYATSANSNHAGLYALIETDPALKKSLETKNEWGELEESLRGKTVLDLLKEHLSQSPYPGVAGEMIDSEYAAVISQATAHAKIVTILQDTSKNELSRFLAATDLLIEQFSQGNKRFSSLVQTLLITISNCVPT